MDIVSTCSITSSELSIGGAMAINPDLESNGRAGRMPGDLVAKPTPRKPLRLARAQVRRGKRKESFAIYIYRLLKQVHPNLGISKICMANLESFMNDLMERISTEAGKLVRYTQRQTMAIRDVQAAAQMILRGQLSQQAMVAGSKAVAQYNGHGIQRVRCLFK